MSWNDDQLFSSKKQDWATPQYIFDYFDRFYRYGLDAAATAENSKCKRYITPEQDSLGTDWSAEYPEVGSVWLNPPYGRGVKHWMKKCHDEADKGLTVSALVMARTDTRWWHDWCMRAHTIFLIKGRIKFIGSEGVAGNAAPAPSALITWRYPSYWPESTPQFRACQVKQ